MVETVFLGLSLSMVLYYLYETDVVIEYLKLFGKIIKSQKIKNYMEFYLFVFSYNYGEHYFTHISKINNGFFYKLIGCPVCFGFWMSLFVCLVAGRVLETLVVSFISLFGFYVQKLLTKLITKI